MPRFFNTAGPCVPALHYMLPATRRLPQVRQLIERQSYFVLHAPRQVGKTTALRTLAAELTHEGGTLAIVLSMETGVPFRDDIGAAEDAILADWRDTIESNLPQELWPPPWPSVAPGARIRAALSAWSSAAPRPLVVFLDEIDALEGDPLVSVLRQLRSGYQARPTSFPWALALCGMRDVRDYKLQAGGHDRSHSASPFNIKIESLTLRNFTEGEVDELYAQHTTETGQVFTPAAVERAFYWTQGQPWLVNALGRQLTEVAVLDRTQAISAEDIDAAKEALILRRDTHLDSLGERLREPRVRRIIEPILTGALLTMDTLNDDLVYTRDLGLVADKPNVRIANPMYQEVIPRTLSYIMQATMVQEAAWYQRPDGNLDMPAVLRAFQRFFAENSEAWLQRFDYHEAGPHLILMAFLQRIINGGGQIHREFAIGSGRVDLVVRYRERRAALELKLRYSERTEAEGTQQLARYLARLGEPEGFLLIFDRRPEIPWADKLYEREVTIEGRRILIVGL